ncbi:DUF7507 domain-containing protein [Parapedobacter sp. DT-150]|uniref:DUF7927 domain-containing protein n=1 Tax=Parapedobacter sp. DT-150 TaxID=3396162 RepID=UPI003F1BAB1B
METYGQQSSLGDNIFKEDFGQATTGDDGNSSLWDGIYFKNDHLPYISSLLFYNPNNPPSEYGSEADDNWGPRYISDWPLAIGGYSLVTNSKGYNNPYFHDGGDHTGNDRGFMVLVDAHASTGLYFDRAIDGLCAGTQFQFAVWIKDINAEGYIKPSVTFNIYNADLYVDENSSSGLLASYTSTDDDVSPVNQWNEVKMSFTMPQGVDNIRLQIKNAVAQEIGNDLAIDDITLRPVGPPVSFQVEPDGPVCVGSSVTYRARVLDNPYVLNHFLLQKRKINPEGNDPLGEDFINVDNNIVTTIGTDDAVFQINPVTADDDNYEYRVIVAGDPSTLTNKNCRVASEPFTLRVYHHEPAISFSGVNEVCVGEATTLLAMVTGNIGDNPDYFFIWETSSNQTDWSVIGGQSQETLNTGELTQTAYYRVTAYIDGEGGCPGKGASAVLEVPVNPLPDLPMVNDVIACAGNDLSIAITDYSSPEITYTLEKQVDDAWVVVADFTFSDGVFSKDNAAIADAGTYRVVAQNEKGCQVTSEEVVVTVNAVDAGSIVGDQTVCLGTVPATIASVAGGSGVGTVTYRWESSTNQQDWNTIAGATSETYSAPALSQNTFFRRVAISTVDGSQCEAYANVVTITVNTDCNIISEKTVVDANSDGLAQAGEQLTYTIAVNNTYDRDIAVDIADQIPVHTVYISNATGGTYSSVDNNVAWNDLIVPAGGRIAVSFIVEVIDNLTGIASIRNVAAVTGDDPENPEEPEVEIPTDPAKSFTSVKTADKQSVKAGEEVTYTIRVTNTGDVDYNGITVADAIPAHTSYKEGSAGEGASFSGGELSWTVDVPFGDSREVSFTVIVADDLTDVSSIRNVAAVTGDDPENPEEPEVEIPTDPAKSFTSVKTADKQSVKAGEEVTYTIRVTNTGDVDYNGITVADAIPAHTSYKEGSAGEGASFSGGELSWTVDVPFGDSREVSFTVIVADDLTDVSSIRNVAAVTGDDPENPEEPEVEIPVDPNKKFTATKVVVDANGNDKAEAGEELTYTIVVENTGNEGLTGITITDKIPDRTTYVDGSASDGAQFANGRLLWVIDVPFGQQVSVSFNVRVNDEIGDDTVIKNIASVTGDDQNPENPEVEIPLITGPTTHDDEGVTDQGVPLTIDVLANDVIGSSPLVPGTVRLVDPNGALVTALTIAGEGDYRVDEGGQVRFTPTESFVGNSTATYTVADENDIRSNAATISIIVQAVAAEVSPTAVDDTQEATYGQPVTIAVLDNDVAGSSAIIPNTVRLIDGSGNRVTTLAIPGEGTYAVDAQGSVTFSPVDGFSGVSTAQYEVSDENGLVSNVATITVNIEARPFKIPNVFTPNGDGRNDAFEIVGIEGFDRVEITVVNRWGNEVYRNGNYKNDWDGQGLNEGTYYYVIITHGGGQGERHAGWVLIKRQ